VLRTANGVRLVHAQMDLDLPRFQKEFVDLMNLKAQELGLHHTVFHSPHGLPPETRKGQEADLSTARDLATLSRKLIAETDVLRYSSTAHHDFRHQNGVVIKLDTHNHLLGAVPGCDGLKTGFYRDAGFSLVATVQRGGRRIIAVILGSPERKLRDIVTTQLIERGFAALPPLVAPAASAPVAGPTAPATSAAGAAPARTPGAPATPLQPAATPTAEESGPRLIPVGSDEQKPPAAKDAPQDPAVHFAIPGKK